MKQILVFLFVLCFTNAFAQDIIVKKDFTTITAKVLEIGTNEVKYKNWSNQDGPTYTMSIKDVYQINYANGTKDNFSNVNIQQDENMQQQMMQGIFSSNAIQRKKLEVSAKHWRAAGGWCLGIGFVGGIITGLILDDSIGESDNTFGGGTYWLCVGIGTAVGLGGFYLCRSIADDKESASYASFHAAAIFKKDFELGKDTRFSAGLDLMKDKIKNDYTLGLGLSFNF